VRCPDGYARYFCCVGLLVLRFRNFCGGHFVPAHFRSAGRDNLPGSLRPRPAACFISTGFRFFHAGDSGARLPQRIFSAFMSPQRNWFGHCIQSSVRDAVADRRPATEACSDLSSRSNPGSLQNKNPLAARAGRWLPPIPQQRRRGRRQCAPMAHSHSMRRLRAEK